MKNNKQNIFYNLPAIDLQLHAPEDDIPADITDPTFGFKGPGGVDIVLPEKIGDVDTKKFIGHIISQSRKNAGLMKQELKTQIEKEIEGRYKPFIDQLKEKNTSLEELQAKLQKFEEDKLSIEEKTKLQYTREIEKAQKEANAHKELVNKNWMLFKENKISNDIFSAFSGFDLCNAEQTAMLLKNVGRADLIEENGNYKTVLKIVIDGVEEELTPKEAVKKWLALQENAHHLKNNLRPGGGTSATGGKMSADGSIVFTRSQLKDPKYAAEYWKKKRELGEDKIKLIED